MSLEEYFSTGPAREKPIFEAVHAHLKTLGPVHVEPVSVGIFLKCGRTFAELRPMRDWVALSFSLRRRVDHALIRRKVVDYHGRYYHVVNLREAADLDADILGWLADAYLDSAPSGTVTGTTERRTRGSA
jgi:hypothetical protein